MSKLGKKPLLIPTGVEVSLTGKTIEAKGPLGKQSLSFPDEISLVLNDAMIKVNQVGETKRAKSMHGTYVRLLANLLTGVNQGFTKVIEVVGTGFKAEMQGEALLLSLGYSHQITFPAPVGVTIQTLENKITISGIDCQLVGLTARRIKSLREPDSYKGKGLRYLGQKLKLKPGKAAAKGVTTK